MSSASSTMRNTMPLSSLPRRPAGRQAGGQADRQAGRWQGGENQWGEVGSRLSRQVRPCTAHALTCPAAHLDVLSAANPPAARESDAPRAGFRHVMLPACLAWSALSTALNQAMPLLRLPPACAVPKLGPHLFSSPSHLRSAVKTHVLAGMLRPIANVSVLNRHCSSRAGRNGGVNGTVRMVG
jgi:hypothetical protein